MICQADYLVTGDGKTVVENAAVWMQEGKIRWAGPSSELPAEASGEEVRRYPGATLMPGMIDMHEHIAYFDGQSNRQDFLHYPHLQAIYATRRMTDTLKAGVTTIRDVSSGGYIGVALNKAAQAGYITAPRIFTCGRGICMTGGHGATLPADACWEADGVEEVRKAVRFNLKEGANCIKILTSEGYRGEEMSQEEIDAAVREAHRFGVRVAAHAGYGRSIQMCIDAGCDTIEHGTHLTREQCLQMKAHDQTWVPTIYVFEYSLEQLDTDGHIDDIIRNNTRYLREACRCYEENFKTLYDTGVRVACGTDTDSCDHPQAAPVFTECSWMVRLGLTPLQAIQCATQNGAEALGCGDWLGLVKPGYAADLIAVQGKPFEDIGALSQVQAVYLAGRPVVG